MPVYSYRALDKGGKEICGSATASGEQIIIEKLISMGCFPMEISLRHAKPAQVDISALPGLRSIFHRITTTHMMTFTRQFATLIDAGLPMLRSLSILSDQVESVLLKKKIEQIGSDIESGSTLSDALARHPKVFDRLYVNMVRAGEMGGVLEAVLNKIAQFLEKRQAIIGKIRSAMMYPAIVVLIATAIVTFILVKIVPKFKDIYGQLNAPLPAPTQALVVAGDMIAHHAHWVALAVTMLVIAYRQINRTRDGKYFLDRTKLMIPIFGKILRKASIVRFTGTLSTLITAGVPILQALDICRETSGNEVVTRALVDVYDSVKEGNTIHEPLSRCKVFPPLVVHMVAVGEETGAIDQMLTKIAEAYERDVDDTVNALTSILEPVLIVFLGVIIGGIVIALYLPLINLGTVLGKQS